jgi:site-specific recombinase XerD
LTVEDVRNGRIRCNRGKGSLNTVEELREHQHPLLNEKLVLAAWLRERGDGDGSVFLFTSRKGSRLTRQQVYRLFHRCAELAGIEEGRLNPHVLTPTARKSASVRNIDRFAHVSKTFGDNASPATLLAALDQIEYQA